MNEENTLKLTSAFPKLYPKLHPLRPSRETPFFFECRDGWFQLLWDLSEKLEAEIMSIEKKNSSMDCKIKAPSAVQVKEKMGTLRFYMSAETEAIREAIEEAQARSEIICEVCGAPGELRGEKWVYTLCEEHKRERPRKGAGW